MAQNLTKRYFSPYYRFPYVYILYQFDCLHLDDMARLMGVTKKVVSFYMQALQSEGYVKGYFYKGNKYYHLVTKGIAYFEELIKDTLPIHYGTAHPGKDTKQKLEHDVHGTYLGMQMVHDTVEGVDGQGLITWAGPMITKAMYPKPVLRELLNGDIAEKFVPSYVPDLYMEYYTRGRWGNIYVEIDASGQSLEICAEKVRKCRRNAMYGKVRSGTDSLTVAFVTMKKDLRCENLVKAAEAEFIGHSNPILTIATSIQDIETYGPFGEIWRANDGSGKLYSLYDLSIEDWDSTEEPILVGTSNWRDALQSGQLNLYDYMNPSIKMAKPWDAFIKQEEERAAKLARKKSLKR